MSSPEKQVGFTPEQLAAFQRNEKAGLIRGFEDEKEESPLNPEEIEHARQIREQREQEIKAKNALKVANRLGDLKNELGIGKTPIKKYIEGQAIENIENSDAFEGVSSVPALLQEAEKIFNLYGKESFGKLITDIEDLEGAIKAVAGGKMNENILTRKFGLRSKVKELMDQGKIFDVVNANAK